MTNAKEMPSIPGIRMLSERDAGTCVVYEFAVIPGEEQLGVTALLGHMKDGHHVCVSGVGNVESYLEVRRPRGGFEIRTSHHGSSGSWRSASAVEAQEFLAPSALLLTGTSPQFTGTYTIYPLIKND
jgi:hypothetical protein